MRTIAPRFLLFCALLAVPPLAINLGAGTAADTPSSRLADLASSLSQNDKIGALEAFDKQMASFATVSRDLSALIVQTEILCSIDILEDREDAGTHIFDLDWFMQLKSRTDPGLTERRRQRVAITMRKTGNTWRITSLTPEQILAPIAIK